MKSPVTSKPIIRFNPAIWNIDVPSGQCSVLLRIGVTYTCVSSTTSCCATCFLEVEEGNRMWLEPHRSSGHLHRTPRPSLFMSAPRDALTIVLVCAAGQDRLCGTCFLSSCFFFFPRFLTEALLLPHPCFVVIYLSLLAGWLESRSMNSRGSLMLPLASLFVCSSSCFWSSSTVLLHWRVWEQCPKSHWACTKVWGVLRTLRRSHVNVQPCYLRCEVYT